MPQAQDCEGTMCLESSGKPDAWKLARPVWGWGRGAVPRPTPPKSDWGDPMNHIVLLGDSIFDNGSYVHQDQGEEPHPQVGEIVGWSWERQQVAVVTMVD